MIIVKKDGDYRTFVGADFVGAKRDSWCLCKRCIDAIKSRGEKLYVGDEVPFDEEDDSTFICEWCEEEATLYECI